MAEVLVLSEADVAGLLDLEQLLAALADALVRHSAGAARALGSVGTPT